MDLKMTPRHSPTPQNHNIYSCQYGKALFTGPSKLFEYIAPTYDWEISISFSCAET